MKVPQESTYYVESQGHCGQTSGLLTLRVHLDKLTTPGLSSSGHELAGALLPI